MSLFEILAILGALAWLPFFIKVIRGIFIIPEVRIITQRSAQIGFTTYGPIFNTRIAFAVKHKDIVISSLKIKLIHESGEVKIFSWQGIIQTLGEMRGFEGNTIPWEKVQSVLAIKINQKDVEERLIRFQEDDYLDKKDEYEIKTVKKLAYLQEKGDDYHDEFLKSEEMKDLISFIKQWFNWKQGEYKIIFIIESPDKFNLKDNMYDFFLTSMDIEALEKNKESIDLFYENSVKFDLPEYSELKERWSWRNPTVKKR